VFELGREGVEVDARGLRAAQGFLGAAGVGVQGRPDFTVVSERAQRAPALVCEAVAVAGVCVLGVGDGNSPAKVRRGRQHGVGLGVGA
jgi:hypothetical protein